MTNKTKSAISPSQKKSKKTTQINKKVNSVLTICNKLLDTYDIGLLDKMPDEERYNFLMNAYKECYWLRKRPVLTRLLSNYFDSKMVGVHVDPQLQKPVTEYIKGPKTLTVHSSEFFNMFVYIFGEHHIQADCSIFPLSHPDIPGFLGNTMNIENYLEQLIKHSYDYLDYFFEVPTTGRKNLQYGHPIVLNSGISPLNNIYQKFVGCIQYTTRHATECQLGRVHFFDVRSENVIQTDIITYLWMSLILPEDKEKKIIKTINNKIFLARLQSMYIHGCITEKKLFTYFRAYIFGNKYNVVELDRLLKSTNYNEIEMGITIEQYITNEIGVLVKLYFLPLKHHVANLLTIRKRIVKIGYRNWTNIPLPDRDGMIKSFKCVKDYVTRLVSIGPDLYVLSRMFKSFNLTKPAFAGAVAFDQPTQALNIVIYAGDAHSQKYRRFLNMLDFKEVAKTGHANNDQISCIDMKYIPQPFFSGKFNTEMFVPPDQRYDFEYDVTYNDVNM